MTRETRKQKERAAKRREYLLKLAEGKILSESASRKIKKKTTKKEISEKVKTHLIHQPEKIKAAVPVEYIISDFKKAILLSGLFVALLIIIAILEARYGFLGPLASKLMEKLVK